MPLRAMAALNQNPLFAKLDDWLGQRLGLSRQRALRQLPTVFCETGEEFYGALFLDEPIPPAVLQELMAAQLLEAEAHADAGGGIFGVFLGAHGCYVNGWLYQRLHNLEHATDALRQPAILPAVIGTAAHEKWGHGFVATCTALGKESTELQLDRCRYARAFPRLTVTTPEGRLMQEKWSLVFMASRFLEEGWASWVDQYVSQHLTELLPGIKSDARPQLPGPDELIAASSGWFGPAWHDAVRLLLEPQNAPAQAVAAMAWLEAHEAEIEASMGVMFQRPPRYVIGHALCVRLTEIWGAELLPSIIVLAANVRYDLSKNSVSDLQRIVLEDPALNVNRRLAALGQLTPPAGANGRTAAGLAQTAREQLGFGIPEGFTDSK